MSTNNCGVNRHIVQCSSPCTISVVSQCKLVIGYELWALQLEMDLTVTQGKDIESVSVSRFHR